MKARTEADGPLVSGGADGRVRVWSGAFEIQHTFIGDSPVTCLVNAAGVIAAGCQDGAVHLLRLPRQGDRA